MTNVDHGEYDDDIGFLDDAAVELIEEPPTARGASSPTLDTAITRVWIRPYAGR